MRTSAVGALGALFAVLGSACGETHPGADGGAMDGAAIDAAGPRDASGPGDDAGPVDEPCDRAGEVETLSCGRCGTWTRFCTADLLWTYGPCEGELEDACMPGETGETACGRCGRADAVCTDSCEWLALGDCTGEGTCTPGERRRTSEGCPAGETQETVCNEACMAETVDACRPDACSMPGALEDVECGMCGTQERFCEVGGVWAYGPCEGEHGCTPGTTTTEACGMCGTRAMRCTLACELEPAGDCTGEGTCAPGAMQRTTAGCPPDQTRLLRCDDTCAFVEAEPCVERTPMDVILLFDMTGSHASQITAGVSDIRADIVAPLLALEDVAVGVAEYADFPDSPYGSAGDVPFRGRTIPTTVSATVDAGIGALATMHGGDSLESGVEALAVLAGIAPHPRSLPFACPAGTGAGGCWRAGSVRVVVVVTDARNHAGPMPDSSPGVYEPYLGISPAPQQWPAVRAATTAAGIHYFAVILTTSDAETQHQRMISELGLDPGNLLTRTPGSWTFAPTLVSRIAALR